MCSIRVGLFGLPMLAEIELVERRCLRRWKNEINGAPGAGTREDGACPQSVASLPVASNGLSSCHRVELIHSRVA